MSNRGGTYEGPGGQKLSGDGKPLPNPSDFIFDLYRIKPDEIEVFGDNWCSTITAFEHSVPHRVAFYPHGKSDGQDVSVYVDASPARFYTIEAMARDNKPSWKLGTGSGFEMAALTHHIARAIAGGMLALHQVAGGRMISVNE